MRPTILAFALLFHVGALAENNTSDPQTVQTLLTEVRQLRHDLEAVASTIQRVQITMFRLQSQTVLLDRASERVGQARTRCQGMQLEHQQLTSQMEEVRKGGVPVRDSLDQQSPAMRLASLQSSLQDLAAEEQRCQVEQAEAEGRFRMEQAKMNDLEDQLDRLDRALSAVPGK
jgi:chromosome segregation ATPase